ncbi:MAG: MarR family transcriptional regulator [Phycisphaeraceae bacterium]|nr:MarR family transcriptional regulator [Phycisphaeraceae bacterium]
MPSAAKSSPVSPLDAHLGYWLRLVSNDVSHSFRLKVESKGVTVAEWVIMRALLDSDGANPSRLADQIGLTRGAVSKLVDRLVEKEMARIVIDKKDRRFQAVSLTPAGRRLVPQLAALADENDAQMFGFLGAERRGELAALLREIAERRGISGAPVD